ncbi:MAG TPA: hypothetical protein QF901_00270, partial [Gammaproteobacteria bacterium]|nr:hypothetical protein [Gammaproteobacteria bacterium]
GNLYAEGVGVDKDFVRAYAWCGTVAGGGLALGADCSQKLSASMDEAEKGQARRLTKEYRDRYGARASGP